MRKEYTYQEEDEIIKNFLATGELPDNVEYSSDTSFSQYTMGMYKEYVISCDICVIDYEISFPNSCKIGTQKSKIDYFGDKRGVIERVHAKSYTELKEKIDELETPKIIKEISKLIKKSDSKPEIIDERSYIERFFDWIGC